MKKFNLLLVLVLYLALVAQSTGCASTPITRQQIHPERITVPAGVLTFHRLPEERGLSGPLHYDLVQQASGQVAWLDRSKGLYSYRSPAREMGHGYDTFVYVISNGSDRTELRWVQITIEKE